MTAAVLTPSADYRRTHLPAPKRLWHGFEAVLWGASGRWHRRRSLVAAVASRAEGILAAQANLRDQSDARLAAAMAALGPAARLGRLETQLDAGLALAAETARRTLGLQPYREQLMGALVLERGGLAEMATGEGKTLALALAAVVAGWAGRPVHVITANDYLAERDAVALRPFYHACGLTVGHVSSPMPPPLRRLHYRADILYGTSKEIVADFLRDRLALGDRQDARRRALDTLREPDAAPSAPPVQRGLHTAIIDEADHVLIDEAVTPLLISQPRPNELLVSAVRAAGLVAVDFAEGRDFTLDRRLGDVELTTAGRARLAAVPPERCLLFRNDRWKEELVTQAVRARELFLLGRHYVVAGEKIVIVDEATGRPAPARTWRQGLHQAIEAKENLPLTAPNENLASLSFQRFFRLYARLAGVTGTARESAREFWHVYHLPVVAIPTHRPGRRVSAPPVIALTADEKWTAVVAEVAACHARGRPVLVGCGSVAASDTLAARLHAAGFAFHLLNATRLKHEADIIAEAGQPGRITVATHLAGRGTDIRLGSGVAETGGLHVIATERAASSRIDRQLAGRGARQGDPGSVRVFASLDDELVGRFVPGPARRVLAAWLRRWPATGTPAARLIFARCQHAAARLDRARRLGVLRRDQWLQRSLPLWGLDQTLREE